MQPVPESFGKYKHVPGLYQWVKKKISRVERRTTKQELKKGNWEETTYFKPRTKLLDWI